MRRLRAGMSRPWVVAHRGASAELPENTLAAFDRAIADGCDAIELDVQLSRDGVPVVFHDWTLDRAGLRGRRPDQLDVAELQSLDAGDGQRIPALRVVLERYRGRVSLLLELKTHERTRAAGGHRALAAAVRAAVRAGGLEDEVLLLSFDEETLAAAVGTAPRPRAVLNLSAPRRPTASFRRQVERWHALSFDVRTLTPAAAAAVRELGKPVLTWTCNTPRRVRRALDCGADAIMSDRPDWLGRYLSAVSR